MESHHNRPRRDSNRMTLSPLPRQRVLHSLRTVATYSRDDVTAQAGRALAASGNASGVEARPCDASVLLEVVARLADGRLSVTSGGDR